MDLGLHSRSRNCINTVSQADVPPAVLRVAPATKQCRHKSLARAQFVLNLINTEIEISIRVVKYGRATYIEMQ